MALDDATLVNRYQQGNPVALDVLIKRHQDTAFQYAYRLTRDPDQACDVVGDAFVRICRSLPAFKGQCAFKTWLYRIIMNCYLDMKKRMKSREVFSLEAVLETGEQGIAPLFLEDQPQVLAHVQRRERQDHLLKAIDSLHPTSHEIIFMFYVEMKSHEEIMAELRLPLGTVKSRLNRARVALKDALVNDRDLLLAA